MADSTIKIFKRSDIKKTDEKKRVIIHNSVYDVTEFLNEHPGGEEVLLEQAGEDATEAFEDIGHSKDARLMMNKYKIGELDESERKDVKEKIMKDWTDDKDKSQGSWNPWIKPIAVAVLMTIVYRVYMNYY